MSDRSSISLTYLRQYFSTQEETLEAEPRTAKPILALLQEKDAMEKRILLTPEAVGVLARAGFRIWVESGAGSGAQYADVDYSEHGAEIVDTQKAYSQADFLLKIQPPLPEEAEMMRGHQVLFSYLFQRNHSLDFVKVLQSRKITAFALEYMADRNGLLSVVRVIREIEGMASVQIAAEYLSNTAGGKGILLGGISGITPCEVVILGAGTAGEAAARAAMGLGAFVKVLDDDILRLEQLQNHLGTRMYTSILHPQVLDRALHSADVVIVALDQDVSDLHFRITCEMVSRMKRGSVIVDLGVGQSSSIETASCCSAEHPVGTHQGVIHYCVPYIASRVARTSSIALSNVMVHVCHEMLTVGVMPRLRADSGLRQGVYLLNGILTHSGLAEHLGLPFRDIHLLMAAF